MQNLTHCLEWPRNALVDHQHRVGFLGMVLKMSLSKGIQLLVVGPDQLDGLVSVDNWKGNFITVNRWLQGREILEQSHVFVGV